MILPTLTFVVSLCSLAYEFVYSRPLTMIYGGMVTQCIVAIGLYFFNLGIDAAFLGDLNNETLDRNFFHAEVLSAAAAPAGFLLIIGLNSVHIPQTVSTEFVWAVARPPVVAAELFSGFEFPLLTRMFDDLGGNRSMTPPWLRTADAQIHGFVMAAIGTLWTVERVEGCRSGLPVVLAMNCVGSLVGTVVYARVLHPDVGLIPAIFALALFNGVVAFVFVAHFGVWSWWPLDGDEASASTGTDGNATVNARADGSDRSLSAARVSRTLLVVCLLLTTTYVDVVAKHDVADKRLS